MGTCVSKAGQVVAEGEEEEEEEGSSEDDVGDEFIIQTVPFADFIFQNNPIIHNYLIVKCLSSRSFASLFLVKNVDDDRFYFAKIYQFGQLTRNGVPEDEQPYNQLQNSLNNLSQLNHRYIISLVEAFTDETTNTVVLVFPLAPLGNLKSMILKQKCSQATINLCFLEIAIAGAYMHSRGIVHRDIKPENILGLSEDYFVLTDFYLSQHIQEQEKLADPRGTVAFLAPEVLLDSNFYPKPADVWAYGISLYESFFGYLPFGIMEGQSYSVTEAFEHVKLCLSGNQLEIPTKDETLKDLLTHILEINPAKRYTFEQIVSHPFFESSKAAEKAIEREDNQFFDAL